MVLTGTMIIGFVLLTFAAIAFALWWIARGDAPASAPGDGNAFEAYYGKSRWQFQPTPPCEKCERRGCIGAGECRCACHGPPKKK